MKNENIKQCECAATIIVPEGKLCAKKSKCPFYSDTWEWCTKTKKVHKHGSRFTYYCASDNYPNCPDYVD